MNKNDSINNSKEHAIEEILDRWEDGKEKGQSLTPEELCSDRQDLLPDVKERIKKLEALQNVMLPNSAKTPHHNSFEDAGIGGLDLEKIGHYQIISKIASGGMGVVYKALSLETDEIVALKVMRATTATKERFHREAKALFKLSHPGITKVHSFEEADDAVYIVMEFLEGEDLRSILRRHGGVPIKYLTSNDTKGDKADKAEAGSIPDKPIFTPPPDWTFQVVRWVRDAAIALDYAHKQGMVHRDIKPSNIFLCSDGVLKVMDFGLVRDLDQISITRTGDFMGTPCYMSPEQLLSKRIKIDHRTDIYSLGLTLYELLAGVYPYQAESLKSLFYQVIFKKPPSLKKRAPWVPRNLETIIKVAISKEPKDRYETAADFAADLTAVLNKKRILGNWKALKSQLTSPIAYCKRHPLRSVGVGVLLLCLSSLFLLLPSKQTDKFSHLTYVFSDDFSSDQLTQWTPNIPVESESELITDSIDKSHMYALKITSGSHRPDKFLSKQSFNYSNNSLLVSVEYKLFQNTQNDSKVDIFGLYPKDSSSDDASIISTSIDHKNSKLYFSLLTDKNGKREEINRYISSVNGWLQLQVLIQNDRKVSFIQNGACIHQSTNPLASIKNNQAQVRLGPSCGHYDNISVRCASFFDYFQDPSGQLRYFIPSHISSNTGPVVGCGHIKDDNYGYPVVYSNIYGQPKTLESNHQHGQAFCIKDSHITGELFTKTDEGYQSYGAVWINEKLGDPHPTKEGYERSYSISAISNNFNMTGGMADSENKEMAIFYDGGYLDSSIELGALQRTPAYSKSYDMSADGQVIVGFSINSKNERKAIRWIKNGEGNWTMEELGDLPGGSSESFATAISADGHTIVGVANWIENKNVGQAFRWTLKDGMQLLGLFPSESPFSKATDASGDGSVIIGVYSKKEGDEGFVWTEKTGIQNLRDMIENKCSLNLSTWKSISPKSISTDGKTIVGTASTPPEDQAGWYAVLGDLGQE